MDRKMIALMLVGAAGATCSVALAAESDQLMTRVTNGKVLIDRVNEPVGKGQHLNGTFGDRAVTNIIVYNGSSSSFSYNGATLGNCSHILEDINLAPGPYDAAFTGTRTLSGMEYSYGVIGGTAAWDIRFSYYRPSQVNWAGFTAPDAGMVDPTATPYYTLTITGFDTNICPGFVTRSGFFLTPGTVEMPAGDSALVLQAAAVLPGTPGTAPVTSSNLLPNAGSIFRWFYGSNTNATFGAGFTPTSAAFTEAALAAAGNPASPGRNHPQYGRDANYDGTFMGQSLVHVAAGAPVVNERRYINSNTFTAGGRPTVAYVFGLIGQIETGNPAPVATSLNGGGGSLDDGQTVESNTLDASTPVRWYKFNVASELSYTTQRFLDIDTEDGQNPNPNPASFAVFTPDGAVFDFAESRGSGPDAPPSATDANAFQVSYGVGRRLGVDNGEQYAGQEGVLPAGEYYVAVGLAGTGFGDGWTIDPVVPASPVTFTLNLTTNNNGAPLDPAAAPALAPAGDRAVLLGGLDTVPEFSVRARATGWVRFFLTNAIPTTGAFDPNGNPLSDVTFLDITMPGSSVVGEWNLALYDNAGTLMPTSTSLAGFGFNNNTGPGDGPNACGGSLAQLSYGTAPSRGIPVPPPGLNPGRELNNQNGSALPADQYYLVTTLGDGLFFANRWGARSTRGSSLTATITINSDNRGPSTTCPADFNGDLAVDNTDFTIFVKAYNNFSDLAGDLNLDTFTDASDFGLFATAFNDFLCP